MIEVMLNLATQKGDPYHERNINDFTKCYYAANDNKNGQREHTQQGYH